MAETYRKLTEITQIPAPDDLVQGRYTYDLVVLSEPGTYKRGMLLMSGSGGFVPATSAGIAEAEELCICSENLEFSEGTSSVGAYFRGGYNADRIILGWEQEGDVHSELIEEIRTALRKHGIFLH